MPYGWFRLYKDFDSDPKVQILSEAMQRRLIMLMCEHCGGFVTVTERHRMFHWRVTEQELAETKAAFIEGGFIDEAWNLLNWAKRQYESDSSTSRTRRYRERMRTSQERHGERRVTNSDVQEQIQNRTDTEQNTRESAPRASSEEPLSPEMVAAGVQQEANLHSPQSIRILETICRVELKTGIDPTALRDEMVASWKNYQDANISFRHSAEKFFGDGYWRKPETWAVRKPTKAEVKPKYLTQ